MKKLTLIMRNQERIEEILIKGFNEYLDPVSIDDKECYSHMVAKEIAELDEEKDKYVDAFIKKLEVREAELEDLVTEYSKKAKLDEWVSRNKVEKAIKETLVVENKDSIKYTLDRIFGKE